MDELLRLRLHKENILTEQLRRLTTSQACLEDVLQRANSSIQSASDVQFLLSRSDIPVCTPETKESYSIVLEPEAQFLPEFTRNGKSGKVRIQIVILVIHELAWDQANGFLRAPFFSPG